MQSIATKRAKKHPQAKCRSNLEAVFFKSAQPAMITRTGESRTA
jgi:hypothetical protein